MNIRDMIQQTIRERGLRCVLLMVADAAKGEASGIKDQEDSKHMRETAKAIKALGEATAV